MQGVELLSCCALQTNNMFLSGQERYTQGKLEDFMFWLCNQVENFVPLLQTDIISYIARLNCDWITFNGSCKASKDMSLAKMTLYLYHIELCDQPSSESNWSGVWSIARVHQKTQLLLLEVNDEQLKGVSWLS